jgi:uncharacterized protein (TIGR03083 family)
LVKRLYDFSGCEPDGAVGVVGPDESWQLIEEHRLAVADLLEALTEDQWEQASLCEGWRVRDVAAHLALGTTAPSVTTMLREAVRAHGSFDRLNHDMAVRHARRPGAAIVDELRQRAGSREVPPVTSYRNLVFDVLVHGQDIAVPVGMSLSMPVDGATAAIGVLWSLRWPFWTQRRFRGLSFTATDTVWSAGAGPEVKGPVRSLLLALSGRAAGLDGLSGPGLVQLTSLLSARRAPHQASPSAG